MLDRERECVRERESVQKRKMARVGACEGKKEKET